MCGIDFFISVRFFEKTWIRNEFGFVRFKKHGSVRRFSRFGLGSFFERKLGFRMSLDWNEFVLYGSKNMIRFGDLFSVWSWFGFFEKKNLNSEWVWIGMSLIRIL